MLKTLAPWLGGSFTTCLFLLLFGSCEQDWASPHADTGLAYCMRQCNTATLRLTSIELRDHSDGNTVVCHCEVRQDSLNGLLDGGAP